MKKRNSSCLPNQADSIIKAKNFTNNNDSSVPEHCISTAYHFTTAVWYSVSPCSKKIIHRNITRWTRDILLVNWIHTTSLDNTNRIMHQKGLHKITFEDTMYSATTGLCTRAFVGNFVATYHQNKQQKHSTKNKKKRAKNNQSKKLMPH